MAQDKYLDLALVSAFSGWNDAEHAAEDQVKDGEQHRGIQGNTRLGTSKIFDPFSVDRLHPSTSEAELESESLSREAARAGT